MKKFRSYAFWVALAGAVVLFLDNVKSLLNIEFDTAVVQSIILSFCGVLVVLGIVSKKDDEVDEEENKILKDDTNEKNSKNSECERNNNNFSDSNNNSNS